MKLIISFFRSVIYVAVSAFSISFIYWAFGWLMNKILNALIYFYVELNTILFWILLFALGFTFIRLCISLFSWLSTMIVTLTSVICPNITFASWIAGIFSVANFIGFVYLLWVEQQVTSFLMGLILVVITLLSILLTFDIINATQQAIKIRNSHYEYQ